MKRNWRFHALAILVICIIITVLYATIGPKKIVPQGEAQLVGDRYIQIYSATWGLNCNDYIDQLNEQRRQLQLHPQASSEDVDKNSTKQLARVTTDNALVPIGTICNGKLECSFDATSEVLGGDPLGSCFKRLLIGFRCFTYDRLRQMDIGQGENVVIDCRDQ